MADKVASYELATNGQQQQQQQKLSPFKAGKVGNSNIEPVKSKQTDEFSSNAGSGGYYPLNMAQKGKLILPTALWVLLIIGGICFLTLMASLHKTMGTLETMVDMEQEKLDILEALERHQRIHHEKAIGGRLAAASILEEPILGRRGHKSKKLHHSDSESRRPVGGVPESDLFGHHHHKGSQIGSPDIELVIGIDDKPAKPLTRVHVIDSFGDINSEADIRRPKGEPFDDLLDPSSAASLFSLPSWISLEPSFKMNADEKQKKKPKDHRHKHHHHKSGKLPKDGSSSSGGVIITASTGPDGETSIVEQRFGDDNGASMGSMLTGDEQMPGFIQSIMNQFMPMMPFSSKSSDDSIFSKQVGEKNIELAGAPSISAKIDKVNINLGSSQPEEEKESVFKNKAHQKKAHNNLSRQEEISSLSNSIDNLVSKLMASQQSEDLGGIPNVMMFPQQHLDSPRPSSASFLVPISTADNDDSSNINEGLESLMSPSADSPLPSLATLLDLNGPIGEKPAHHSGHHRHSKKHSKNHKQPILSSPDEFLDRFASSLASPFIVSLDGNNLGASRHKDDQLLPSMTSFGRPQLIQGNTHLPSSIGQSPYELRMQPASMFNSNDDDISSQLFKNLRKGMRQQHHQHKEQPTSGHSKDLTAASGEPWNFLADDLANTFVQNLLQASSSMGSESMKLREPANHPLDSPSFFFIKDNNESQLNHPDGKSPSDKNKQSNSQDQVIGNQDTLLDTLDSIFRSPPDSKLVIVPESKEHQPQPQVGASSSPATAASSSSSSSTENPAPSPAEETLIITQLLPDAMPSISSDSSAKQTEANTSKPIEATPKSAESGASEQVANSSSESLAKESSTSQQTPSSTTTTTVRQADLNDDLGLDLGLMSNIFSLPQFGGQPNPVRTEASGSSAASSTPSQNEKSTSGGETIEYASGDKIKLGPAYELINEEI